MFSNRARELDVPTLLLTAASCLLSAVAVPGCDGSKTVSAEPGWPKSDQHNIVASTASRVPTFYRDICPIVYGHCVACHRPDGSGPFNLLTYADVKGRGSQIAKVTRSRFMPPWLAKAGDYEFIGDCHLTDEQIGTIEQWVTGGTVEGDPSEAPPPPKWRQGWYLGEPDLIVQMPQAYRLAPGGTDVWRQFVIPVPLKESRYVRAVEIRPGNKRIVHHAIVHVDSTNSSRGLDYKDGQPGYDGMAVSPAVHSPDGHFLSWLPGLIPFSEDPEMSWRLDPGTEFVVETHMLPSGKPESVQISVGIYFADAPPKKFPVALLLHSEEIDIPAAEPNYEVVDSYTLPIAVELLGMSPHSHLLGKEVEAWATLPDGKKYNLLTIPHWDFAWQNAYRFKHPVAVPTGTTLSMRVRFDNSENNIRNPHHPPQRVHFGFQSYDEMAQMTFQVLPRDAAQARKLVADFRKRELFSMIKGYEYRLKFDGDDARLQTDFGTALLAAGRDEDALEHLQKAVELQPHDAAAHFNLGLVHMKLTELFEAKSEFESAIRDDPGYYLAHSELGLWHLQHENFITAKKFFVRALAIHPQDAATHNNLGIVLFKQGNLGEAEQQIREALQVDPNYGPARDNLRKLEAIRPN